jgi:hypothetical protein
LKKLLARAKGIWINDSYWLTMPFKLKDSGVTLKYFGEDTLKNDRYNILELTFKEVGDTPENKYRLYVGIKDKMIKHWAYYNDAKKDTANFIRPWDNYQKWRNRCPIKYLLTFNGMMAKANHFQIITFSN